MDRIDADNTTIERSSPLVQVMQNARVERSVLSLTGETLIIRIIVLGISFISNIIVSRQLGPGGRGILALIVFWSSFISTIAVFGLDSVIIYLLGYSRSRFHLLIRFSSLYTITVSILIASIIYLIVKVWFVSNIDENLLFFLMIITSITIFQILLNALFIGIGCISKVNISALAGTFLYLLILSVYYLQRYNDLQLVLWANVISQLTPVIVLFSASRKIPRIETVPVVVAKALNFAFKAYLGNIANVFSMRANFLVLSFLVPVTELGIFAIAQVFSDVILLLPNTLMNVLLPRVTGLPEAEVVQRVSQIVRCTMSIALVMALGIGGFATVAIPIAFGKNFALAVPIVWLLTIGTWLGSGGLVVSIYYNALGRPEVPASTAWLSFVVTLVLTVIFAKFLGGIGAAAALCLTRAIATLWMLMMYRRSTGSLWSTMLIARRIDWQLGSQIIRTWYTYVLHFQKT